MKDLAWGARRIPIHEAKMLLEWVLGVDSLIIADEPTHAQRRRYRLAVKARSQGFPLHHITGECWFRGERLTVGPGVFIPRPETEMLVEYAFEETGIHTAVDLCTGSGAIARCLALSGLKVDAVELSARALRYAQENLQDTSVRLVHGDALEFEGHYDMVVSNPPYVVERVVGDVLFDPEMALYGGGEDGMVFPRGLVTRARALLGPAGVLLMEHAESQADNLVDFAYSTGFSHATTLTDLAGRPRFLRAVV